jgi:hypothetical protein
VFANDTSAVMRKEAGVAYFKVLFKYFLAWIEKKNYLTSHSV